MLGLALMLLAQPVYAQRQDDMLRWQAAGTAGASFGDGETAPDFGAALSYWPTRRLGIEFELTYQRKLDFTIDLCPPPRVCILGGEFPVTGRTVSLLTNLVVPLHVGGRVQPYVLAGVGATHLRQRYVVGNPSSSSGPPAEIIAVPFELTRSKKALALAFGGGVEVRLSRRLGLGADVRSLHVFDEESSPERFIQPSGLLNMIRVGSRVTWRF